MKKIVLILTSLAVAYNLFAVEPVKDTVSMAPPTIAAVRPLVSPIVVDTLATDNKALSVILFKSSIKSSFVILVSLIDSKILSTCFMPSSPKLITVGFIIIIMELIMTIDVSIHKR